MADEDALADGEDQPKKKSKLPMLLGLVLALGLGGGSFFAVYSGMILPQDPEMSKAEDTEEEVAEARDLPPVAFVPLQPIVINLNSGTRTRHLKFNAQLEVNPGSEADVTELLPRIIDVLNGYLRAISLEDLEAPHALIKIRSHLLRRIQIVTGEGKVRDLLIMEFVLN